MDEVDWYDEAVRLGIKFYFDDDDGRMFWVHKDYGTWDSAEEACRAVLEPRLHLPINPNWTL